jgi:hypothetical protein
MILLIAGVAAILGAERLWRRREYCLRRAATHRTSLFPWNGYHMRTPLFTAEEEEKIATYSPHARWHLDLAARYHRVASRPWESLPVEPEEPIDFLTPRDQQDRPDPGH